LQKHILHPFKHRKHNHSVCIKNALKEAEAACINSGLRLTQLRRQVLQLVWLSHAPVKAYEILEQMHKDNPKTAPPTVYRTLDFLIQAGLVHKIESLNAYVGCGDPTHPHIGQFFICEACGAVAEINEPRITRLINQEARHLGFQSQRQVIEIKGHCPQCQAR
jgi:Fur family zinc uptake transcriptional regulator